MKYIFSIGLIYASFNILRVLLETPSHAQKLGIEIGSFDSPNVNLYHLDLHAKDTSGCETVVSAVMC